MPDDDRDAATTPSDPETDEVGRPDTRSYLGFLNDLVKRSGLKRTEVATAMKRARSWATQILKGQRALQPDLARPLAEVLGATPTETAELVARVEATQANSENVRDKARRTVAGLSGRDAAENATEDVLFHMSKWYVGAIFELTQCEGFRSDPSWIAATLHPPIAVEDAERALQTLKRLGLIDDDGAPVPDTPSVATQSVIEEGAMARAYIELHRESTHIAHESLALFKWNERALVGSVIALSDEGFAELSDRLCASVNQAIFAAVEREESPNRLYRIGLTVFPASLYTDTEYDPSDLIDPRPSSKEAP